jgi:hypothetical protein
MSKVTIAGDVNGTGVFTIASPNGNTNRTLTLPDVTATVITDSAGILNIGAGQVYKDASGNVGIGTSSPSAALTLGSGKDLTYLANSFASWTTKNYQGTYYFNNGSDRVAIDSSGNLMVGTQNNDPTFNRVSGFVINPTGSFSQRSNASSDMGRNVTSGVHVSFYTDNGSARVTAGNINSNGSTTSFATSSDYRMKTDVEAMSDSLNKVMQLNPVTYNWKSGFGGTKAASQGFIAHELQAVVPECVTGEKDAVDAEGKPQYQGIDTSFLVATLAAAIQELKAIVDAQGAEIASLKGASA